MLNLNLLTIVEEEESKIRLIYEKIRDFFFASDTYEHFSTASRMSSLRIFITALLVGVFAFVVVFSVKKRAAKRFVDAVNKFENYTPESAKTLAELGLEQDKGVISALERGGLSRLVSSVEGDEYNEKNFSSKPSRVAEKAEKAEKKQKKKMTPPPYKADPQKDRFYLSEKKALSLQSIYGGKMGTVSTVILTAVGCVALWVVLDRAIPFILSIIDARL